MTVAPRKRGVQCGYHVGGSTPAAGYFDQPDESLDIQVGDWITITRRSSLKHRIVTKIIRMIKGNAA